MRRHKTETRKHFVLRCGGALVAASVLALPPPGMAGEIFSNGDTILRWDNVLSYQSAFRLERRDPALLNNINTDDADRNFTPGLVSNRFDLLSQLDLSSGAF